MTPHQVEREQLLAISADVPTIVRLTITIEDEIQTAKLSSAALTLFAFAWLILAIEFGIRRVSPSATVSDAIPITALLALAWPMVRLRRWLLQRRLDQVARTVSTKLSPFTCEFAQRGAMGPLEYLQKLMALPDYKRSHR